MTRSRSSAPSGRFTTATILWVSDEIAYARTIADSAAARTHGLVRSFVQDVARRAPVPLLLPAVSAG